MNGCAGTANRVRIDGRWVRGANRALGLRGPESGAKPGFCGSYFAVRRPGRVRAGDTGALCRARPGR